MEEPPGLTQREKEQERVLLKIPGAGSAYKTAAQEKSVFLFPDILEWNIFSRLVCPWDVGQMEEEVSLSSACA